MTIFPEYESFDGLGLASLVQRGVISPKELLTAAIDRIEKQNPKLNAVVHKMYEEAHATIENNPPNGIFSGVPFLLKDLLAGYAGVPLTFGSRFARQWIPKTDSEIVKRFKHAGLVILGKTNTPEFGLSPVTEPELFGPTFNPWDLTRSPGGSSGGSAAAVASGMVPMAHGGDGGGSLRIPAAYCGIFGLKPSRGRTPAGPHFMRYWQGMVVEHALTRSVRDSAAILDVLSGVELGSPISLATPKHSFLGSLEKPLPKLRVGVIDKTFFGGEVLPEYLDALKATAKLCEDLGCEVESTSFSIKHDDVALAFFIVMIAETAAGIKLLSKQVGRKPKSRELEKLTSVLYRAGDHFSAADFSWASRVLDMTGRKLAEFFQKYDVLLTPTMASRPPLIGEFKPDFTKQMMLEFLRHFPYRVLVREAMHHAITKKLEFMSFTLLFNISGQPAMSVPLFLDKQGLPIGMQFVGRINEDETLFQLAYRLEQAKPWGDKRPK